MIHGNRYDIRKKVFLEVSRSAKQMEIVISDEGKALIRIVCGRPGADFYWPARSWMNFISGPATSGGVESLW